MIPKGQILFCIYHVVSYFRYPSFQFAITNSHCVISINIRVFFFTEMGETPNHLLPAAGYQDFQFPADRMFDTVSFFQ